MNENIKILIVLSAIFILAFGIRGNLLQYNSFFEPDQYFHARETADLVKQGHVNNPDQLAYYQLGGAPQTITSPVWMIGAGLYNVLFGWNIGFDYVIFTKLMQMLPVIFGSLICIVLYFVGKAASNGNKTIGIIAAFVAAVVPAFVYRTMAGAQMDNSFGFLPFSLGILFLIWAFNENYMGKKHFALSILSGFCFMFMVFAWSQYLIVPLVLLMFWAYYCASRFFLDKNPQKELMDITCIMIIFGMFSLGCMLAGYDWINVAASFMGIPTLLLRVLTFVIVLGGSAAIYLRKPFSEEIQQAIFSVCCIGLIGLIIGVAYFTTLGIDPVDRTSTGAMVGEESLGQNFFIQKYNVFNVFPVAAFLAAVILFVWKKNKYEFMPLFLGGLILFFVMAWLKLKFTFSLGFGMTFAAIIISMLLYELWLVIKNNSFERKITFVPMLIFVVLGVGAAGVFILDYVPSVDADPDMQAMLKYIETSTPSDAKLLNEWGMGHILSYVTGRKVSSDNRNYSALANKQFAQFENLEDTNAAYNMVRDIGADYVLVKLNDFYGLQQNEFYINERVDGTLGTKFREPIINVVNCSKSEGVLICPNMGSIEIAKYSNWTNIPIDFYDGRNPIYVYAIGTNVVVLNSAANNTNLAKVLTGYDKRYELSYISSNYVLIKVLK